MGDDYLRDRNGKIIGRYDREWIRDRNGKLVARYDKGDDRTRTFDGKIIGPGDQRGIALGEWLLKN